jgi:hypothetical protein
MGRAADRARTALRAALGDRIRSAGPDRTEALALDGTAVLQREAVTLLGDVLRVIDVAAPIAPGFTAFLDGIQRSTVIAYLDGVPLLHGTAAAAIRNRTADGRMRTWDTPRVDVGVYGSRTLLGESAWSAIDAALRTRGQRAHDTDDALPIESRHPSVLLRQAFDRLSRRRDDLERQIGNAWCEAHADQPLYVDGSLRTSSQMLRAPGVVGVIKSHASVYGPAEALPLITSLAAGQRTSIVVVGDRDGRPVFMTWYLRLRSAAGRDPFFGLIRAEMGMRDASRAESLADRISGWLLAERAPIARPDPRWDVMPYAIRDCESYLRAIA